MRLDILQLVVHDDFHIRRGGNVFLEQRWVLLKGFGLNFTDRLSTLGYVILEFMASLSDISITVFIERILN